MARQQTRTRLDGRQGGELPVRLGRALVFVVAPSVAAGALLLGVALGLAHLFP